MEIFTKIIKHLCRRSSQNKSNSNTLRVHAEFNQAVASTGRLSSNNPNLQNIPIRNPRGREIRKAFICNNEKLYYAFC